jgi:hypothetical protein
VEATEAWKAYLAKTSWGFAEIWERQAELEKEFVGKGIYNEKLADLSVCLV